MGRAKSKNVFKVISENITHVIYKDKIFIVDTQELENLSQFYWFVCQTPLKHKYIRAYNGKTAILMHRYLMSAKRGQLVDHINGNTFDNRKCNLRLCTTAENNRNAKKSITGKSKYKGVVIGKKGVFYAKLQYNKKYYHLGTFDLETDAALAYDKKARELFKDFAKLNFPEINEYNFPIRPRKMRVKIKISEENFAKMLEMRNTGMTIKSICDQYGVDHDYIRNRLKRQKKEVL